MTERLYAQLLEWYAFPRIKPPSTLSQEVYSMIGLEAYRTPPVQYTNYIEKHFQDIADDKILGVCDCDPKRRWRSYGPTYIVSVLETIFSEQKI